MKFTEEKLEQAIIDMLEGQGFQNHPGHTLPRETTLDVLIKDDLRGFLAQRYASDNITEGEISSIIRALPPCIRPSIRPWLVTRIMNASHWMWHARALFLTDQRPATSITPTETGGHRSVGGPPVVRASSRRS